MSFFQSFLIDLAVLGSTHTYLQISMMVFKNPIIFLKILGFFHDKK